MSRFTIAPGHLIMLFIVAGLIAGCGRGTDSPSSPLPTPRDIASPMATESPLPPPSEHALRGRILVQLHSADLPPRSWLETSDWAGSERRKLTDTAPALGSAAVSPDQRLVAFFTSDAAGDGALSVWDLELAQMRFELPVPAEISHSFRDAAPERYLVWSPEGQILAAVFNRDLHLVDVSGQRGEILVRHREAHYTLAGQVMGSIGNPVWSSEGTVIVYDTFSPPDILTTSADQGRDVERAQLSTSETTILLEDARLVRHTVAPRPGSVILESTEDQVFLLDLETLTIQEIPSLLDSEDVSLCYLESSNCAWIMSDEGENDVLRVMLDRQAETYDLRISDLDGGNRNCKFQSILWRPDSDTLLTTVGCAGEVSLWTLEGSDLDSTHLADWAGVSSATLLSWFE